MVWNKLGTTTLSSAGDDLDITSMTANKFNQVLIHVPTAGGGTKQISMNFDNNTNTDYAFRRNQNGTETAFTSQTKISSFIRDRDDDGFTVSYILSIDSEETLLIGFGTDNVAAGATTVPDRNELAGKMDTTTSTSQFTRIDINNPSSGSFDTDSNLTVIGSDGVESLNVQDGAIYYDTDLNKEYVLYNNTWTEV